MSKTISATQRDKMIPLMMQYPRMQLDTAIEWTTDDMIIYVNSYGGPSCYSMIPTGTDPRAYLSGCRKRAARSDMEAIKRWDLLGLSFVTSDLFKPVYPTYRIGNYAEMQKLERKFYGVGKFEPSTHEIFSEMLDVLPPENWTRGAFLEFFTMSERMTGTLTSCYIRYGDDYYHGMVDLADRSTFPTIGALK